MTFIVAEGDRHYSPASIAGSGDKKHPVADSDQHHHAPIVIQRSGAFCLLDETCADLLQALKDQYQVEDGRAIWAGLKCWSPESDRMIVNGAPGDSRRAIVLVAFGDNAGRIGPSEQPVPIKRGMAATGADFAQIVY